MNPKKAKKTKTMNKIAVIGAGSWGTAIASILSYKGYDVSLWVYEKDLVKEIQEKGENTRFLPGYKFSKNLSPTNDLAEALKETNTICMVVPSQFFRGIFKEVLKNIQDGAKIVSAVKGIENDSLATMTQVMAEECAQKNLDLEFGVLSGPSFAAEVAKKIPTAVTIGFPNIETAKKIQEIFVTDYFRVYAGTDMLGLEISAAFKNIIAIATGICDGLGYGLNTRAALITRGLAEITRFGVAAGAQRETFAGLSGMGDLILTCTGDLSRNRSVGLKLGKGQKLDQILSEMNMVAEGVKTTLSGFKLKQKYNIEMPILEQVYEVLYEDKDCKIAVKELLGRELKVE